MTHFFNIVSLPSLSPILFAHLVCPAVLARRTDISFGTQDEFGDKIELVSCLPRCLTQQTTCDEINHLLLYLTLPSPGGGV